MMPDWFRGAWRRLLDPEQCLWCGEQREDGRYVRDGLEAYCSVECNLGARRWKWRR